MAILNIFDEGSIQEVKINALPTQQNFQQKFVVDSIIVKAKAKIHQADTTIVKGTGLVNSIVPPLLMNSSAAMQVQHKYVNQLYIHSLPVTPTTFTTAYKDTQGASVTTIKIKGSYANNTSETTTAPYWS